MQRQPKYTTRRAARPARGAAAPPGARAAAPPPPRGRAGGGAARGAGAEGTVMGIVVQVAPEDRQRAGERVRLVTTLAAGDDLVDRQSAVVELADDGSAMVYREWKPGAYELRVAVAAVDGDVGGMWVGAVEVPAASVPFAAPEGAPVDAVALRLTPPAAGQVQFRPPPERGGIGALQLELDAPATTSSIEFFLDEKLLNRRNRPPWTVSVSLGEVVKRTTVRAVARDAAGGYLGEDALVLNSPTGQLGVEILLAPESTIRDGLRRVTVAVSSHAEVDQVKLSLDNRVVARWAACPCVVDLAVADLAAATILAAEVEDRRGTRGDAVVAMAGGGGFGSTVKVELVELAILALDGNGVPVKDLTAAELEVREDDAPVTIEGFGTTADLTLSLALAVDTSGSMTESFPRVRAAIASFTSALLRPGDEATLLSFAWEAKSLVGWTDDVRALDSRLERVVPEGGTSLHDAVVRSLEQFRGRRGRQALVLLTDGEDTTSRTGWATALRFAHTMRIPIFPVGLGVGKLDFAGRGTLNDLARETGGEAFFPADTDQLTAAYARIGDLLRSQYLVWYSSGSTKPADQFRAITVTTTRPGLTLKTIRGYYPGR